MGFFPVRMKRYQPLMFSAGLLSLLATMFFGGCSPGTLLLAALIIAAAEGSAGFVRQGNLLPYLFLLASPVTLIHYSTTPDFSVRILSLIFFCFIAASPLNLRQKDIGIPEKLKKPASLWLLSLMLFILLSIWLDHKGLQLSGDEPHYLMVTQSLVEDSDLSLKNNWTEQTYRDFIPAEITPHVIIQRGKHLSFHMPGLSFLLIPFYIIFKLTGGLVSPHLFFRISISMVNSFFPLILFLLLRNFFPGKRIFQFWLLSVLSVPLLFHAAHIYPELPAATLTAASFLLIFGNKKNPLLSGLLFSFTIWFHLKYYPLLAVYAAAVLWTLFREGEKKDIVRFIVFPVVSSLILLAYCKIFYGTFNPAGIFPAENYWATPVILKIKVFLAYFLDQRDGLLTYAPFLFLFPAGFHALKKQWRLPVLLLGSYTVFHAITTVRGAHAPAGRPLIFVLWIILLFTANYYYRANGKSLFRILAGLNFFILFWILQYPRFIYQPVFAQTTDGGASLLKFLGSNVMELTEFFPSFLTQRTGTYLPNLLWPLLITIILSLWYSGKFQKSRKSRVTLPAAVTLFFILSVFLISFFPHVQISANDKFRKDGVTLFNSSRNFVWLDGENRFRIKGNEEYVIYLEERAWKKNLAFSLQVPESSGIVFKNRKKTVFTTREAGKAEFSIHLDEMGAFKMKGRTLVPLWIKTRSDSDQPFFFLQVKGR